MRTILLHTCICIMMTCCWINSRNIYTHGCINCPIQFFLSIIYVAIEFCFIIKFINRFKRKLSKKAYENKLGSNEVNFLNFSYLLFCLESKAIWLSKWIIRSIDTFLTIVLFWRQQHSSYVIIIKNPTFSSNIFIYEYFHFRGWWTVSCNERHCPFLSDGRKSLARCR